MDTDKRLREQDPPKTLWTHTRKVWREINAARPFSFYLLFAILVVVALGSQVMYIREDPRKFALFLTLNFVFFFFVMVRALIDLIEIVRRQFREREELFRETLGEESFTSELGQRVANRRREDL